jgi:hypothetical protein
MRAWTYILGFWATVSCWTQWADAQQIQFPAPSTSIRTIQNPGGGTGTAPVMVPLNGAVQQGIYPSTGPGSTTFDPYSTRPSYQNPPVFGMPPGTGSTYVAPPTYTQAPGYGTPVYPGAIAPGATYNGTAPGPSNPVYPGTAPGYPGTAPTYPGTAPGYPGTVPVYPGTAPGYPGMAPGGASVYNGAPGVYPPSMIPNTTPPSLFPTPLFGQPQGGVYGSQVNPYGSGNMVAPGATNPYGTWNPQGSLVTAVPAAEPFVRLFQGPRFRHTWVYDGDDPNSLQIHDSDVSLAFVIPNFLFSTQPLYILPSFSLHLWDGPRAPATADLPSKAYSAYIDTGWQSDPLRIVGAEVGVRVGVFTDFDTYNEDSLRIMGRALGRLRLTPTATLKGGIVYLDRNRLEWLPAGGLLWQPNPMTRFDIFFPEPKLSHYLSTLGTHDAWWYLGGYYGGGSWTVRRANGTSDSIDINDIRVMLGIEWGRNDQLREGRRVGFFEVGYVFDRELIYKRSPADNLDLRDTFMIRAGLGY